MYKYRRVEKNKTGEGDYEVVHEIESESESGMLYAIQILEDGVEGEEPLLETVQH